MTIIADPHYRVLVPEIVDGDLFVTDIRSGTRRQLTDGLTLTGTPAVLGEGVAVTVTGQGLKWIHASGGDLRDLDADFECMAAWGTSGIAGLHTRLETLAAEYGADFWAGGGSGQLIPAVAARIGSRPALLGAFTIPTSGAVTVVPSNQPAANGVVSFLCTVAGIEGTLAKASGTSGAWTFTRTTSGTATPVPAGTPAIPVFDGNFRQGVHIIQPGKNDATGLTGALPLDEVIAIADDAIDYLGPIARTVLVLGHYVDTYTPEVSAARDNINTLNEHFASRYGGRFLDLGAYLTSAQVWTDTGLTPTTEDLDEQALGNKPPSLSALIGSEVDPLHLNGFANLAVRGLIKAKLDGLAWFPPLEIVWPADDFNRADGLPGVTSIGGVSWIQTGTQWQIASNKLTAAGITTTTPLYFNAPSADVTVEADLTAIGSGAANAQGGLAVRVSSAGNLWWLSTRRSGTQQGYGFYRQQAGVTSAAGTTTSVAVAAPKTLRIVADGPLLIGYVDNVEVARVTDATFNETATGVGFLGGSQGVGHVWEDISTAAA